jgi:hypothetical protein
VPRGDSTLPPGWAAEQLSRLIEKFTGRLAWKNVRFLEVRRGARRQTQGDVAHVSHLTATRCGEAGHADVPALPLVANDVKAFVARLPLYAIKPLYPATIAAVTKLGGESIRSAFRISALATAAWAR